MLLQPREELCVPKHLSSIEVSLQQSKPLSILTSILRIPKITVARVLSFRPITCQLVFTHSFSNIPGQYSTNIPAQTGLAHNPSAGLCRHSDRSPEIPL